MAEKRRVIIIGSGPAGLTAALYNSRAGLKPLVFGGSAWGGQLMTTTVIENYPGFIDGIDGPVLMDNMIKQVQRFGAELKFEDVTGVDFSSDPKKVFVGDETYEAECVIIATGATPKRLNVPGEAELYGHGVSTCATCDGAFFRGKVVAVIGGGDTAMEEASFLTRHASKVYILHRRDKFRASKIMSDRVMNDPKVEILWSTEVKEVVATPEKHFSHLRIVRNDTNEESELKADGMFLAIGYLPATGFLQGQVKLTELGYVDSPDGVHTSVPGVFVAGDAEDRLYRQAITAAGAGCRAALEVEKHMFEHPVVGDVTDNGQ